MAGCAVLCTWNGYAKKFLSWSFYRAKLDFEGAVQRLHEFLGFSQRARESTFAKSTCMELFYSEGFSKEFKIRNGTEKGTEKRNSINKFYCHPSSHTWKWKHLTNSSMDSADVKAQFHLRHHKAYFFLPLAPHPLITPLDTQRALSLFFLTMYHFSRTLSIDCIEKPEPTSSQREFKNY